MGVRAEVGDEFMEPLVGVAAAEIRLETNLEAVFCLVYMDAGQNSVRRCSQGLDELHGPCHIRACHRKKVEGVAVVDNLLLQPLKGDQRDQYAYAPHYRHHVVSAAYGDAQAARGPDAGCGGEALDAGALPHNGARA